MKATEHEHDDLADQSGILPNEPEYALNITGVYEDQLTRAWALQLCRPAAQLAGGERIQSNWYEVQHLSDPGVLLEAVDAALQADVIVISIHAADELPPDLYAWIDVWLPRRAAREGGPGALIGIAGPPGSQAARTHEYLKAVAHRGQLEFVPHERTVLAEPGVAGARTMEHRAGGRV